MKLWKNVLIGMSVLFLFLCLTSSVTSKTFDYDKQIDMLSKDRGKSISTLIDNGKFSYCGDGICDFNETVYDCLMDCINPDPIMNETFDVPNETDPFEFGWIVGGSCSFTAQYYDWQNPPVPLYYNYTAYIKDGLFIFQFDAPSQYAHYGFCDADAYKDIELISSGMINVKNHVFYDYFSVYMFDVNGNYFQLFQDNRFQWVKFNGVFLWGSNKPCDTSYINFNTDLDEFEILFDGISSGFFNISMSEINRIGINTRLQDYASFDQITIY